jgi:hypothetical protein
MKEDMDDSAAENEYPQYDSLDTEEIVSDGPGDGTFRPLRAELIPGAEYELDRVNNPTKPASLPRPGTGTAPKNPPH